MTRRDFRRERARERAPSFRFQSIFVAKALNEARSGPSNCPALRIALLRHRRNRLRLDRSIPTRGFRATGLFAARASNSD